MEAVIKPKSERILVFIFFIVYRLYTTEEMLDIHSESIAHPSFTNYPDTNEFFPNKRQ